MMTSTGQRGATQAQLAHRAQLLLSSIKCLACGRLLGEHTPTELLACHRQKECPEIGSWGVHSEGYYYGEICALCGERGVEEQRSGCAHG